MDITLNGSSVSSVQKPFGNEPLMAEIEESSEKLLGCVFLLVSYFSCLSWYNKTHQVDSILKGEILNMSLLPRYFWVPVFFRFKNPMARVKPIVILGLADS